MGEAHCRLPECAGVVFLAGHPLYNSQRGALGAIGCFDLVKFPARNGLVHSIGRIHRWRSPWYWIAIPTPYTEIVAPEMWTAAELEKLTPAEQDVAFQASIVTDPDDIPPEFLDRVRSRLLKRLNASSSS